MNTLKDMLLNPAKYRKFYIALATAILNALALLVPGAQWLPIVISLAGSFGVYVTPNKTVLK